MRLCFVRLKRILIRNFFLLTSGLSFLAIRCLCFNFEQVSFGFGFYISFGIFLRFNCLYIKKSTNNRCSNTVVSAQ